MTITKDILLQTEEVLSVKCNKLIKMALENAKASLNLNTEDSIDYLNHSKLILDNLRGTTQELRLQKLNFGEIGKYLLYVEMIIEEVFSHCKESESVYCIQAANIQQTMKALFDCCAEFQIEFIQFLQTLFSSGLGNEHLQLVYDVLLINMRIASAAHALSVGLMSKQWTMLSDIFQMLNVYLKDTDVVDKSMSCLRLQIFTSVCEAEKQDSKARLRSIKIAQFLIKTLFNVVQLFEPRNYNDVILAYSYIKMLSLENANRDSGFLQVVNTLNIIRKVDHFICETISQSGFLNDLCEFNTNGDVNCIPGLILLITHVMCQIMKRQDKIQFIKSKALDRLFINIYNIICYNCNLWPHIDAAIPDFIVTSATFVYHLDSAQFASVEHCLMEGLMKPQSVVAMLSADLWILILRMNHTTRVDTLKFFCKTYEAMSNHPMFYASPQSVVLGSTIRRIFTLLSEGEKTTFISSIPFNDLHFESWTCIGIDQLKEPLNSNHTQILYRVLKQKIFTFIKGRYYESNNFKCFINILKVASQCQLTRIPSPLKDDLITAWTKLCKLCNIHSDLFIEYFTTLCAVLERLAKDGKLVEGDMVKIFHVLRTLGTQMKTLAFKLIIQLWYMKPKYSSFRTDLIDYVQSLQDYGYTNFAFIYNTIKPYRDTCKFLADSIDYNPFYVALLNNYNRKCITDWKCIYYHKCSTFQNVESSEDLSQGTVIGNQIKRSQVNGEPSPKLVVRSTSEVNEFIMKLEQNVDLLNLALLTRPLTDQERSRIIDIQNKLSTITKCTTISN